MKAQNCTADRQVMDRGRVTLQEKQDRKKQQEVKEGSSRVGSCEVEPSTGGGGVVRLRRHRGVSIPWGRRGAV